MTETTPNAPYSGGETHQITDDAHPVLTTNHGTPIADNQNQLKAGARGPVLLEDEIYREKINHFDHERIPERIVHARGSAAHGYFECTDSLADITVADLFQKKGQRTEVFTRFSTVAGGAGSIDTPRDVRGFAVKFYTRQGNWDLVGNNIPVFFIQDAIKFPDLIHAAKMEADRGYPQAATAHDTFWDFISLMPESTHMVMWAMSDRTLPRTFANMEGFGVHTFRFINKEGKSTFVKFHWKPKAGLASTIWDETVKIAGADPDFQRRDLFERIDRGDFPEWELGVQLFDEDFANSQPYDVLDATKIIPEEVLPVRIVGRMVLDRYPDNFFAETEQAAFVPSHVVPGIGFSNDPLLQGRLFSYTDTQLSRLGSVNFHQLPINSAKGRAAAAGCPFMNQQRDGHMQMAVPKGRANYEPNSLARAGEEAGAREDPDGGYKTFPSEEQGQKLRIRPESFADHYSQARMFFRSMDLAEQAHIASALVFELSKVSLEHIRIAMMANLRNVDEDLAQRVADGLAMDLPPASKTAAPVLDMAPSPALRIIRGPLEKHTLEGRTVGILIADGTDAGGLKAVQDAVKAAGGTAMTIAPKVGKVPLSNGSTIAADAQLFGQPSVTVDACAVILSEAACAKLVKEGAAVQWVMDAFGHLKAIGHNAAAKPLLDKAGVEPDEGITDLPGFVEAAKKRYWDREASVRTLA
ncbi:catalase HPII [Sphingomonas melonis TY]|jgi:catalase|uniref:Catalase n=1 Tax=Sphingomonas melonis TY TaxID=621456 RepID=A0A175Y0H9_9SPHN|nr:MULTISPECIES: catalase [Sphingomonas]AOW25384.1 catalase HPII [Sphingomonas melonis TY]ATI54251.1 catalase HPII [Sphingomonas melonis]KZB93935.1 catalase HPII [Sphingomonas melonis TY]MBI0532109.1 catalase HPII [Sphingomonas sp. TX0522]MBX8846279.1 catalase [Sphingomonas melonis]